MKLHEIKAAHRAGANLPDDVFLKPIEDLLLGRGWHHFNGGTGIRFSYPTARVDGAMVRILPDRPDAASLEIEVDDGVLNVHAFKAIGAILKNQPQELVREWLLQNAEVAEQLVLTDEERESAMKIRDQLVGEMKAVVADLHEAGIAAAIRIRFNNQPCIEASMLNEPGSKPIVKKFLTHSFKRHVEGDMTLLDDDQDDDYVMVTSNQWNFLGNGVKTLWKQLKTREAAVAIVGSKLFEKEIRKLYSVNTLTNPS